MKELKKHEVQPREYYLVFTGHEWSPSGYDIAECYINGQLVSQTNGEDLFKALRLIKIYELPIN